MFRNYRFICPDIISFQADGLPWCLASPTGWGLLDGGGENRSPNPRAPQEIASFYVFQKLGDGNSNIFYFHPENWGNMIHIFQVGWFNHQLDSHGFFMHEKSTIHGSGFFNHRWYGEKGGDDAGDVFFFQAILVTFRWPPKDTGMFVDKKTRGSILLDKHPPRKKHVYKLSGEKKWNSRRVMLRSASDRHTFLCPSYS